MEFTFNKTTFWTFVEQLRKMVVSLDGYTFDECDREPSFEAILGRATGWFEFMVANDSSGWNIHYTVKMDKYTIEVRARPVGLNRLRAVTEVLPPYDEFVVQHIEHFVKNVHRFLK